MAYPERRADSGDPLASSHRSVFFHHARSALVFLGVVVRRSPRDSAPGLRTERSRLAVRLAGSRDVRVAALAIAAARDRSAAGDRADAVGGGGFDHSSLRAPAHCELAFLSALVCRAGRLGATGALRARKTATVDPVVLSRLDVVVGESAWRMALRNGAAGNLHARRAGRKFAGEGCVCRDSRCASDSCHGVGLGGLGGGDARESVWLAAARAHLSLSRRSLPDEPDRRVPLSGFPRLGRALFCGHPDACADRVR